MQTQKTQQPPYLFYSHKCKNCDKLNNYIKQYKILYDNIEFVNVHEIPKNNLPKQLTKVPAILHNGQFHFGVDTVKWVQFYVNMLNQQNNSNEHNVENGNQTSKQNNMPNAINYNEPLPNDCDGGKCVLGYNYLNENTEGKNDSKILFHNLKENGENLPINNLESQDKYVDNNKKEKYMSQQLEQLHKLRKNEI